MSNKEKQKKQALLLLNVKHGVIDQCAKIGTKP